MDIPKEAVDRMVGKALHLVVRLKEVKNYEANILKEEMLLLGGEVAVPPGMVDCKRSKGDVLVMGTLKQFIELLNVMKLQEKYIKCHSLVKDLEAAIKTIP